MLLQIIPVTEVVGIIPLQGMVHLTQRDLVITVIILDLEMVTIQEAITVIEVIDLHHLQDPILQVIEVVRQG